ncbi:Radical SAM domain protein [Denitrovibrio acetiphilus DSM 12809]|uniref:Radical SAM domain protein n=1 Tax=Denitrovibrio acetiphilus (strain DSM 12809 / NBRC 114555 / N2460) TaxID=522772 RepID=D4H3H2_DENA2|nr:radical SAM protein [Denitrovibrio acetiphilus]ADD67256.1 Radical SAM domain protein [Denitrovibrio acetiphilus DSM 12809]
MNYQELLKKQLVRYLDFYEFALNPSNKISIFPEHVHIEPTNSCNLKCIHCSQSGRDMNITTKKRGFMDFGLYCKIIDEIKGKVARISLNVHGEPLLHPQVLDMVRYGKEAGIRVNLLTNATKLTEDITEKLLELKLDRVVFSFDSIDKEILESVRVGNKFLPTFRNILYFIKRNYETGRNTFICASMVLFSKTEEHKDEYNEYFMSLPVDTTFNSSILNLAGSSSVSHEVDMQALHEQYKGNQPICKTPWENITVNWDGTVSPCPLDYNEAHVVGDANTESLFDIWNGEKYQKFRQCHLDNDFKWIDDQGVLCSDCNGRYFPDYDLRNQKKNIPDYIVRQFEVYAKNMYSAGKEDATEKYEKVCSELNRVNGLLKDAQ